MRTQEMLMRAKTEVMIPQHEIDEHIDSLMILPAAEVLAIMQANSLKAKNKSHAIKRIRTLLERGHRVMQQTFC